MSIMKIAIAAVAASLVTPALADFRYTGSPKFGVFYDNTAKQAQAAPRTALDANASLTGASVAPRSPFKGGIGHREP